MACIFKMINGVGFAMVMWNVRRAQTKNPIDIAVFLDQAHCESEDGIRSRMAIPFQ